MLAMFQYNELIEKALKEDIGTGDLSTLIIPDDYLGEAKIFSKEHGVVCGIDIARMIFEKVDPRICTDLVVPDGEHIFPGMLVMRITGPLAAILQAERTALNFLQHLSGISSITRRMADIVADLDVKIVDTRKTLPGMRSLQKYAVRVGGGSNHRFGLYDAVLLKDNHHAVVGGLQEAIKRVKQKTGHMVKIEVECETLAQVQEAMEYGVDVIMLDNMSVDDMQRAVQMINKKVIVEASGGINENNIREIAETGVDILSVGRLTHSVPAVDFSLVVDEMKPSMQKHISPAEKI